MNNAEIKIVADSVGKSIEEVLKVMSRAEKSALNRGAAVLKKNIKQELQGTDIDLNKPNDKYNDKLIDAIRSSKVKDGSVVVHIMGTRKSGSGTFRLRFFEGGTKERFAKTYNGKPLKKKRALKRIEAHNFFSNALSTSESEIMDEMDKRLKKYIEKAWNNG